MRGEANYKSDLGAHRSIAKKGKSIANINPEIVKPGVQISNAKISDVQKLLKHHFGENWAEMDDLIFYKNVINNNNSSHNVEEDDPICEAHDEHIGDRI